MVLAETPADFEFNPAAPEFIPRQPLAVLGESNLQITASYSSKDLSLQSPLPFTSSVLVSEHCTAELLLHYDAIHVATYDATAKGAEAALRDQRKVESRSQRKSAMQNLRPKPSPNCTVAQEECKSRPSRQHSRHGFSASVAPCQVATLVVKNLALDLKQEDVRHFLDGKNATPMKVDFHRDANGAFRGTAFVRYASPGKAKEALERLGSCLELGGRKARVELQKSKALFGRRSLEAELPQEELDIVREEIERFLGDPTCMEVQLPSSFSVFQRKYVHSLAERHSLAHVTQQNDNGEKYVFLSKSRQNPLETAPRNKANSFHLCDMQKSSPYSPKATPATDPSDGAEPDPGSVKGTPEHRSDRRRRKAHSFCVSDERNSQSPCLLPSLSPKLLVPSLPPGLFESEEEEEWAADCQSIGRESFLPPSAAEFQTPFVSFGAVQSEMLPPGLG